MNTRDVEKASYIWNTSQSMMFAMQSALLLMVIQRTNNLDDAGVFSIAYAISSLMYYIGEFGVRKYQITDINERVSFCDYHTHRVITSILVIIVSLLYAGRGFVSGQYTPYKFAIIMIVCCMKALEAYSDVYFSRFQQKGRLDVAAKASMYRITLPIIICSISLVITHDLMISMLIWLASAVVSVLTSFILVAPEFGRIEFRIHRDKLIKITRECFPLFAGNFLLLYIGNAPKYAIDACLDDKAQACFNFIFMPVFVIGMLANFIFNPILVKLAEEWAACNYSRFTRMIVRQLLVIGGITLLAITVALTIGCPVLGILFNTDLSDSRMSLTILMVGGGMLALANFFTVVVTVVRGQKHLFFGYIAAALAARLLSRYFVVNYGVPGAAILYATLMTLLSLLFAVIFILCVRSGKKNKALQHS